ncbi:MAG: hypothetical protein R2712_21785 [Vicinamibacterales bacterium]
MAQAFLALVRALARKVSRIGALNGLGQPVLKLVSPGVPDFYQGTELWSLSLVDPDNRRDVDYATRRRELQGLEPWLDRAAGHGPLGPEELQPLLEHWQDGRIKLLVTAGGLWARRAMPQLFGAGAYVALDTDGRHDDHLIACARDAGDGGDAVIAVVPRLAAALERGTGALGVPADAWDDTYVLLPASLAPGQWRSLITGAELTPHDVGRGRHGVLVRDLLADCPVAALLRASSATSA